jgi:outer membrane protein assembly factor BamB
LIVVIAGAAIVYFRVIREDSQQWRNLYSMETCIVATCLLLVWVLFLSRLRWKIRLIVLGGVLGFVGLISVMFRIHGVSGDLVPVLRFRWSRPVPPPASIFADQPTNVGLSLDDGTAPMPTNDFPQFLGPLRNATLPEGPNLARDWISAPPKQLWRQPIGAGWSGFAVEGHRAVTMEQHGEEELVVCYELLSGNVLWAHSDKAPNTRCSATARFRAESCGGIPGTRNNRMWRCRSRWQEIACS